MDEIISLITLSFVLGTIIAISMYEGSNKSEDSPAKELIVFSLIILITLIYVFIISMLYILKALA